MSASPTTSINFPNLPAELRLKIWKLTFQPRVVQVYTEDGPYCASTIDYKTGRVISDIKWVTKHPNPVALSLCSEARAEALRVYTVQIYSPDYPNSSGVIFLDPQRDIVYLFSRWGQHVTSFVKDWCGPSAASSRIRSVAVSTSCFKLAETVLSNKKLLKGSGLDMLTLVEGDGSRPYQDHLPPDDESGEVGFAAPSTAAELIRWEKALDRAQSTVARRMTLQAKRIKFRVVMVRRGLGARDLDLDHCTMEGPVRHDPGLDFWLGPF